MYTLDEQIEITFRECSELVKEIEPYKEAGKQVPVGLQEKLKLTQSINGSLCTLKRVVDYMPNAFKEQ